MIIIHGEDTGKSYRRLVEITDLHKRKNNEVVIHESGEVDATQIRQEMGSQGLFLGTKVFVLKNFLSTTKSKNKDAIISIISAVLENEIILWEARELTATMLKPFPSATKEVFKIDQRIFKFLDSIRPGNTSVIIRGWKDLLDSRVEPEFVFAMLLRQVRLLIQSKSSSSLLKINPYAAKLISSQAKNFTMDRLLSLHHRLYEIDGQIKTGVTSVPMELLLTDIFQKV